MGQRIYAFEPPSWRSTTQTNLRSAVFGAGLIVWLLLYGWLTVRLWRLGPLHMGTLGIGLIAGCVVLGVLLALSWRRLSTRWRARLHRTSDHVGALPLAQLQALSPSEFETYVAQRIFARHGYKVDNVADVKDGGIDIRVSDHYGRVAVVQCKRYAGTVGEPTVRDLYGTMIHAGAAQAYLITTGRISSAARLWATGKPITLVDGEELVQLAKAEPEPHDVGQNRF